MQVCVCVCVCMCVCGDRYPSERINMLPILHVSHTLLIIYVCIHICASVCIHGCMLAYI